ncbi:MAG: adaptor protein MecA, partial [Kyrpidia sp.]|nr:adaptor protein MecA [Kyrpidia sp.]
KVRIFISYDDLEERGIGREEIWQNGRKIQELFWDMMEKAYIEVGFEVMGPIAVEAFTMPAEGVVVVVSQVSSVSEAEEEDDEAEPVIDEEIGQAELCFAFQDFEDVVQAAYALRPRFSGTGKLFAYHARFYLYFPADQVEESQQAALTALAEEYGERSRTTPAVLEEYGTTVFRENAVGELCARFPFRPGHVE